MTPRVLNKRTDIIPPDAVYVGRPSKWGNPFRVGMRHNGIILNRKGVISAHKDHLLLSTEGHILTSQIKELRGKDLVCWCAPLPCHADILLELANKGS